MNPHVDLVLPRDLRQDAAERFLPDRVCQYIEVVPFLNLLTGNFRVH